MHRQLSALEQSRQHDEHGGCLQRPGQCTCHGQCLSARHDLIDEQCVLGAGNQHHRRCQKQIGQAAGQKFFVRCHQRGPPRAVKNQQLMQSHAGGKPSHRQQRQMVADHHQAHGGQGQHQPNPKLCLTGFTREVSFGIPNDHPAHKADQQQHRASQGIGHKQATQHAEGPALQQRQQTQGRRHHCQHGAALGPAPAAQSLVARSRHTFKQRGLRVCARQARRCKVEQRHREQARHARACHPRVDV